MPIAPGADEEELGRIAKMADGFLFTGGKDIHPRHYGEEAAESVEYLPEEREETDLDLIRIAFRQKRPMLGICYGMQLINVARGGDLYQDIPSQVPEAERHRAPNQDEAIFHRITVNTESKLHEILEKSEVRVNTSHHQAVKNPGEGLRIVARSDDGIIEGVELEGESLFCLGVQWHPERMTGSRETHKLFQKFINECKS